MFSRLSIFYKMLVAPLLALLLFLLYMSYVVFEERSNQKDLLNIQNRYFPILTLANENIVLFNALTKSFEDAVGANEVSWLDNSAARRNEILNNLNQLKNITDGEHKNRLMYSEKSFLDYYEATLELSRLLINDSENIERIEALYGKVPANLMQTRRLFELFRDEQYGTFAKTVKNINERLDEALFYGVLIGLSLLALILFITIQISLGTRRSAKALLGSVTSMADGNPDFSLRIKQESQDELGMLVQQYNRFTEKLERDYNELQAAKQNIEAAHRTKSEFLANVSHEIRTPLNAIIGFSELMESTSITEKQSEYLHSIKTGSKVLLSLINDILDLSKIEAGKLSIRLEPTDLRAVLNEVCQIFEPNIKAKKLDLRLNISSDMPASLFLDETRVRQVLFNLLGNAIKFTDSGFVELRAYVKELENRIDKVELFIEVEDSGIGIPTGQQQAIFESFQQQKGQNHIRFGGTGLGLTISLKLVQMMGGTLAVKSSEGKGSTFTVLLYNVDIGYKQAKYKPLIAYDGAGKEEYLGQREFDFEITDANIISLWQNTTKSGMYDDILLFCEALIGLADKEESEAINIFAKALQNSVGRFDIGSIEKLMREFESKIKT